MTVYSLTEMALDHTTWRLIRCPWCWSLSSVVWVGGQRTTGCSGPGSPWTYAWRCAATQLPPFATRTPDRKRSPTSPDTVARMVLTRTQPGRLSSTGSGTGFPVDGKRMRLVRADNRYRSRIQTQALSLEQIIFETV